MKQVLTRDEIIAQFKAGRFVLDSYSIKVWKEYCEQEGIINLDPNNAEHQEILVENEIQKEEDLNAIRAEVSIPEANLSDFDQDEDICIDSFEERIEVNGFVKEFDNFLLNEKNIEREENKQKERLSVRERMIKGYVVTNLSFVKAEGNFYSFKVKFNFSNFRRGSSIVLKRINGEEVSGPSIKCKYWDETEELITLKIESSWNISKEHKYIITEESDFSIVNVRRCLQFASQSKDVYNRLKRLLFHDDLPKKEVDVSETNSNEIPIHLDDSQKLAFFSAVFTDSLHLIQGPPGTGKTSVLASIAIYFAKKGKKVLITGFTHSSINNALNRVKSLDENVAIAKFGRVALGDEMIDEGIQCLSSGSVSHKDFIAGEGWIAGATVFESSKNIYRSAGLDVVIIDESSQLNSALALCALSLAPKTIMLGDHMQLPPIVKAKYDKPYLDKSLFEYLIEKFGGTILSETYRMSNELSDFPSRMFYSSRLFASQRVIRSDESVSLFGSTTPIIWISYDQKRKTRVRARKEAILIRETIQELVRQNIPPSDIGIVSPFRAQIKYVLKEIGYETEIDVNTVEKFQGREKRIIILSLVSNDVKFLEEVKEFYFDVRRFNVAITRAKTKMIIVANSSFLDFDLNCSGYRIMREYLKTGLKVVV